ncbi:AAA family ATPase [Streptomyces lonarensis]|uniref:AAA family ATPase n=1 Tax=Streptomyces lonarensis TaxID=700599 RepID=A0A7X6I1D7_9ACTN|nr:AAA family ATPase [Streptomyces lonarensis]
MASTDPCHSANADRRERSRSSASPPWSAAEPPAAGRTGPAGTEDLRGPYEPFEPSELPADHTAPSAPSAQPGPSDARPGEGEAEVVPLPTPAQPPAGASRPPHHAAPPAPPLTVSGAVHPRGPSGALRPAGPVPAFAGREDALAAIAGRLAAATATATTGDGPADPPAPELICGAPGVGKTALAREVASRLDSAFPGGRWLLPMTLPDGTPRAAAHAAAELSAAFAAESPRGVLLVLDDVTDAEQVRPLLPLGPGCAVLVTSRRGLAGLVATHGGTVHRVQPLAPVDSARLLTAALGADRAGREPGAVTELAEGCGHHPLALRVAAARLLTRPALSLADGARWLAQDARACLSLPGDPSMSVSTVLDTAVGRLSPELRALFHRLATAPGPEVHPAPPPAPGGPEPTPEQPAPTEPALEQLADAGLLEDGPPGPYRMHPLLRRYARWAAPGPGRHPVDPDSVRPTDRCE